MNPKIRCTFAYETCHYPDSSFLLILSELFFHYHSFIFVLSARCCELSTKISKYQYNSDSYENWTGLSYFQIADDKTSWKLSLDSNGSRETVFEHLKNFTIGVFTIVLRIPLDHVVRGPETSHLVVANVNWLPVNSFYFRHLALLDQLSWDSVRIDLMGLKRVFSVR